MGTIESTLGPHDNWLTDDDKRAIIKFHYKHPLEGYRRLTWMIMDANVVACSPGAVCNVLRQAELLTATSPERSYSWQPSSMASRGWLL
ncbi:MAG: hypothetical protein ACKOEO_09945, partial [Planctomycetaceae bacterium]